MIQTSKTEKNFPEYSMCFSPVDQLLQKNPIELLSSNIVTIGLFNYQIDYQWTSKVRYLEINILMIEIKADVDFETAVCHELFCLRGFAYSLGRLFNIFGFTLTLIGGKIREFVVVKTSNF